MKIGDLTFNDVVRICLNSTCEKCILNTKNIVWDGFNRPNENCIKNIGLFHMLEAVNCEISGIDNK